MDRVPIDNDEIAAVNRELAGRAPEDVLLGC